MAYQSRGRDPLLDAETQAALERRTKELVGLALIAAAGVLGAILASYSPRDPSFLGSATGEPRNLFGYPGAYTASALSVIFGKGAWSLVVALGVWGGRFVAHQGADRVLGRMVFLPLWVAAAAVYAATHPPGPGWTHSFGLGGMFGDLGLGMVIGVLPLSLGLALKLAALALAAVVLGFGLFVLGWSRAELGATARFLGTGLVLLYDRGMRRVGAGLAHRREARTERRAARAESLDNAAAEAGAERRAAPPVSRPAWTDGAEATETPWDDPLFEPVEAPEDDDPLWDEDAPEDTAPARRGGIFARLPGLGAFGGGRAGAEDLPPEEETASFATPEDRVHARIAGAIKARRRADRAQEAAARLRAEPQLRGGGPVETVETGGDWDTGEMPEADDLPRFLRQARPAATDPQPEAYETASDPLLEDEEEAMGGGVPASDIPRFLSQKPVVRQPVSGGPKPSARARAEAQPSLLPSPDEPEAYAPPPLNLLRDPASVEKHYLSDEALQENARMLETVLDDYGVKGDIVSVRPGPVVTMYELEPAPGLKASRVIGLADDIARSMSALSARVSTVPGRSVIGIELPNERREMVLLREILAARDFGDSKMRLPLALGKDIGGAAVVANLAKMPHLLIAGTTGSGKSVAINTMILSLLYKLSPEECRLIMIDPKMLELSVYDGIPHLLSPVVTDPKKAVVALKWVVGEMEDRYRKMSKMGVRNIEGFNGKVRDALAKGVLFERTVQTGFDEDTGEPVFETEETVPELLPYVVVIVDEMADLMMVAGKEIEACIQRLAQMARASGIHLIMATQRPSVDVITGTIKANFPTRISFQVTSKVDSRTILGEMGAEQLLGMGDMLYMAGGSKITRVHGPFASDEEVEEVVQHLKALGPPAYVGSVLDGPDDDVVEDIDTVLGLGGNTGSEDALYDQAVAIVIKDRKCSTSYIQRKLGIGYNKAARLVEQMEDEGLVSAANHVGKREILVPEQG